MNSSQNDERFTVTVHIAAVNTPLDGKTRPSASGHMFYTLESTCSRTLSFGFQPIIERVIDGKPTDSIVTNRDLVDYINPMYSRTLEITKEQYEKLKEFGENPSKYGFDVENWKLFSNSCVDFTWSALNHAGLHANQPLPGGYSLKLKGYEGHIRVPDNVEPVQSIAAPFPDSRFNRETHHARPEASGVQKFLFGHIENRTLSPAVAAQASPILGQCLDGVHKLDAAQGRAPDAGSTRMACSLANLAHDNGLQRVDAVYLSQRQSGNETITGERVFVQQGNPRDVAGLRAGMETAQAFSMPLDTSLAQLERTEQQLAQQRERSAQILPDPTTRRSMDGPALG